MATAGMRTTTHLWFYMHDMVTPLRGSGTAAAATAVRVVRGAATAALPNNPVNWFGDTYAIDDPLMEGPGVASAAVGCARGFYVFASRTEPTLLLSATMELTAGVHGGNSISVLGRDVILDDVKELPVIGGTGAFRDVTGYGLLRMHSFNATTTNAVLRMDMYLNV